MVQMLQLLQRTIASAIVSLEDVEETRNIKRAKGFLMLAEKKRHDLIKHPQHRDEKTFGNLRKYLDNANRLVMGQEVLDK